MVEQIHQEDEQSSAVTKKKDDAPLDARLRRSETLERIAGIWANRKDIPADGLEYERELRREWR